VPAHDRRRLERLCRYVARPPLALDRLEATSDGRLTYRLKTPWRDGTTHVVMERRELLERLAPLIPPPRAHQVRDHGVLAPCARGRDRIVPGRDAKEPVPDATKDAPSPLAAYPTTRIDGANDGAAPPFHWRAGSPRSPAAPPPAKVLASSRPASRPMAGPSTPQRPESRPETPSRRSDPWSQRAMRGDRPRCSTPLGSDRLGPRGARSPKAPGQSG
jgi:hypothetical protein